jgi:hypothetical protein
MGRDDNRGSDRDSDETNRRTLERRALQRSRALPGEAQLDAALVDKVFEDVRHIWQTKGLETASLIGFCVLTRFFNNDLSLYRKRRRQHVSYETLCRRTDHMLTPSLVSRCIGIVEQIPQLPDKVGGSLSVSQHVELLPVKDHETKLALAQRALDENLVTMAIHAY